MGKSLSLTVYPLGTAAIYISYERTTVTGCLDYSIGRILPGTAIVNAQKREKRVRRRRFQSLLIIIEAKTQSQCGGARAQLLTYLACLRQSRICGRRTDTSVYGVASDGLLIRLCDDHT
jgi:hypothetical protein